VNPAADAAPTTDPRVRNENSVVGVAHPLGLGGESGPSADRHVHAVLAPGVAEVDTRTIRQLLGERETAATAMAQALREQIATLTDQLARAETELADLATTRKTLSALTGEPEATDPADATVTSVAYQQILAAFTTATAAMRAKDVCLALGLGTAPKDTEGLRAKLKRLVARQVLIETEPGLFALAATAPSTPDREQGR
jgi:hypothetical protein